MAKCPPIGEAAGWGAVMGKCSPTGGGASAGAARGKCSSVGEASGGAAMGKCPPIGEAARGGEFREHASSKFLEQPQSWGAHAPHVSRKFREHASPITLRVRARRMRAHVNAAHAQAIVRHSPAHGAVDSCSRLRPDPLQLQSGFPWSAHRIVRHSRSDNQCFERGPAFVPPHPRDRGCGVVGGGGHPRDRSEAWDPTPHPSGQRLVSFTCVNLKIN